MSLTVPPIIHRPRTTATSDQLLRALESRLVATQKLEKSKRTATAVFGLVTFAVAAVALVAVLDYFFELQSGWRQMGLLMIASSSWVIAVFIWKTRISNFGVFEVAVAAEREVGRLGQRLRTVLDYQQRNPAPAPASTALLDSMHAQTAPFVERIDWPSIVRWKALAFAVFSLSIVSAIVLVVFVAVPEYRLALGRSILLPLEYTIVEYSPQDSTVLQNESVTLKLVIRGRPLNDVLVRYRETSSEGNPAQAWTLVRLGTKKQSREATSAKVTGGKSESRLTGEQSVVLEQLQRDVEFEVVAGPRTLPKGSVKVLQPLEVETHSGTVTPPSYLHRPSYDVDSFDVKVPEGASVEMRLTFNRPPSKVDLESSQRRDVSRGNSTEVGNGRVLEATLEGNVATFRASDLRTSASWNINATASDGIRASAEKLSVRVQPDRRPEIRFIEPLEELAVTPTTDVPMQVDASDDVQLRRIGIMVQIGTLPAIPLVEKNLVDLEGAGGHSAGGHSAGGHRAEGQGAAAAVTAEEGDSPLSTRTARLSSVLLLEEYRLTLNDHISYYAYADDEYFGEARRTTTPLRFIDIRPYKLMFEQSNGGSCSGCKQLEQLIAGQRHNLREVFTSISQKRDRLVTNKPTLEKFASAEEELRDDTTELSLLLSAKGLAVPAIDEAADHMNRAITSFRGEEDSAGLEAEQMALAALIRARENVRQRISENSEANKACQTVNQQLTRRPEKKKPTEKKNLADAKSKLNELAKREREWTEKAKQSGKASGGPTTPNDEPRSGAQESAELLTAQQQIRDELATTRQELENAIPKTEEIDRQLNHADEALARAIEGFKKSDSENLVKEGSRAAEQMEELAAHLSSISSQDNASRLSDAVEQSKQLAARQETLRKRLDAKPDEAKSLARDEQALADRTSLLSDLLDRIQNSSAEGDEALAEQLKQALSDVPPESLGQAMNEAADKLRQGDALGGSQQVPQLVEKTRQLARALEQTQAKMAQPRLKELVALEEELARLSKGQNRGDQQAAWDRLQPRLESALGGSEKIQELLSQVGGNTLPDGFYPGMELPDSNSLRGLGRVLQRKIQEAILAASLLDADQPVPSQYKELVEKYYRTLSDDLR